MTDIKCIHCDKTLNEYEVNKLWCSECGSKYESIEKLIEQNEKIIEAKNKHQENLKNLKITNSFNFEGYHITKYLDLVGGEAFLGTGVFSEISAQVNDILGTNSETLENKLTLAKSNAKDKLISKAISIGANAIIGVDFDILTISKNMLVVSASGTAVVIKEHNSII